MLGGGGRVRPLTAHSRLEPLGDGQGSSDKPRDQREDWKRFRISRVKCDSGKMLSQHACMSSMKIFIRKVNTFLSPRLSYHKEESTYFMVLTFTECSTNTHASSLNCLGDGPSSSSKKHLEASGQQGFQKDGMASRPPGLLSEARTPSRLRQKREEDFPGTTTPRARGRTSLCSFIPIGQAQIRKNWGKRVALGGNECAASSREASGDPLWGRGTEGPGPPRQLDVNPAAWKEGGHWPGVRGPVPPAAELTAAPSFLWTAPLRSPRRACLHSAHRWMKGTHVSSLPTRPPDRL